MALNPNDYMVNPNDQRLSSIKAEEQQNENNANNEYSGMINDSDKFYQSQVEAAKQAEKQQEQAQNARTDQIVNEINQQKENVQQDYTKNQKGAYSDYMKQVNPYGANAEKLASQGLQGSGISDTANVFTYNAYQNRITSAKESLDRTMTDFTNKIAEARLTNNTTIADIASKSAQEQAQIALQGFEYKNTVIQQIGQRYDTKYQNTWNEINTELQNRKEADEYNEQVELKREEDYRQAMQAIQQLELQKQELELKRSEAETQRQYYQSLIAKAKASGSNKRINTNSSNNASSGVVQKSSQDILKNMKIISGPGVTNNIQDGYTGKRF